MPNLMSRHLNQEHYNAPKHLAAPLTEPNLKCSLRWPTTVWRIFRCIDMNRHYHSFSVYAIVTTLAKRRVIVKLVMVIFLTEKNAMATYNPFKTPLHFVSMVFGSKTSTVTPFLILQFS